MRHRLHLGCVAMLFFFGCSTTYHVQGQALDGLKQGQTALNVLAPSSQPVDLTHYDFIYSDLDGSSPKRVKGLESLNALASAGQLEGLRTLTVHPLRGDKAWQRTLLGGGVAFVAGAGIGFAISNRILLEQAAQNGGTCPTCTPGILALGTLTSAVISGGIGALIAYFAGAGIGSHRDATLEYSQPATEATPTP